MQYPDRMNYRQSLDYIYSQLPMFHRVGAAAYKPDIGNITEMCRMTGNPEKHFPSVHVAGTNGKGSVSHMLASVFMEHGLKTGLFTSPHLKDFRERIRVNGKMIPKSNVSRFISQNRDAFEKLQPSFFEMTAAMAFGYFAEEEVEMAIVETGMGGRLDSTNVITPVLSVITNISSDHRQFLGDTIEKIASEKAGIIKPGIPVVIGETQEQTCGIFSEASGRLKAPILFADRLYHPETTVLTGSARNLLNVTFRDCEALKEIRLISPLPGLYQIKNMTTLLGAVWMLRKNGFDIPEEVIVKGIRGVLKNTRLQGRWQIIGRDPLTICDTGHNEGGLREVVSQIRQTPYRQLHFVFGAVADKELGTILQILPSSATYYFCKADVPRGLDAAELHRLATAAGLQGNHYASVKEAYQSALHAAKADDLVFIGGSTFVVAEVI